MIKKKRKSQSLPYEPPRALRVGDGRRGGGQCETPGSGDLIVCILGNGASAGPCVVGNGASSCLPTGSGVIV